jgi:hypothetical protein
MIVLRSIGRSIKRVDWSFWAYFIGLWALGGVLTWSEWKVGLLGWTDGLHGRPDDDAVDMVMLFLSIVQGALVGIFLTKWRFRTKLFIAAVGALGVAFTLGEAYVGWLAWLIEHDHDGYAARGAVVLLLLVWLVNCLAALVVIGVPALWLQDDD